MHGLRGKYPDRLPGRPSTNPNPMKSKPTTEILARLKIWLALFRRIETVYDDLKRTFCAAPESEIVATLYATHDAYTKLLAETIGCDDEWLDWYLWDNDAGAKGLEAKAAGWKRMRKIKTLEDLAAIVSADAAANKR